MGSNVSSLQSGIKGELATSPRLSGISQKIALFLWGLVTLTSLLSLSFSIYRLNLWDRIPASETIRYFPDMTPEGLQAHTDWQDTILETGLSLSGYASIFTMAHILGSLSLLVVAFLLIRHYSDQLMAVLMATVLSVFAAAGIWNNPLFGWGLPFAPWLSFPVQVLGWLLWCAAIVIYTFPDGKFIPRWTLWLAVLLVPLTFIMAFDIDISLNPNNWPGPLYLLPNIVFIGGGLFAIIYRYRHTVEFEQKQAMRAYVWGISFLVIVYFLNLLVTEVYFWIAGQPLFQSTSARLTYILINEPIWFACEAFFAIGLALSVFRNKLLEST
ncbi:MAG TPA: hypothetical protein VK897_11240 [Anaerolineales bacterium]|nr:hypothetical protein [Anaerolineales bacterium]